MKRKSHENVKKKCPVCEKCVTKHVKCVKKNKEKKRKKKF